MPSTTYLNGFYALFLPSWFSEFRLGLSYALRGASEVGNDWAANAGRVQRSVPFFFSAGFCAWPRRVAL